MSVFTAAIVAKLKGNDAESKALNIEKKAKAAFKGQISSIESKIVDLEIQVEDKTDALNAAITPSEVFSNGNDYIKGIFNAQSNLDAVNAQLDEAKATLDYLTALSTTQFA